MAEFKDRMKQLQEESGMPHWKIAELIGTSKSAVSQWIRGETIPNASNLILICKYFDVSADWALGLSNFRKVKRNG